MTEPTPSAGEQHAWDQDDLDGFWIENRGLGGGLEVAEWVSLQVAFEQMHRQRAPGGVRVVARINSGLLSNARKIHLAGHGQEGQHHPERISLEHLGDRPRRRLSDSSAARRCRI